MRLMPNKNGSRLHDCPSHNYDDKKIRKIYINDLEAAEAIAAFYGEAAEIFESKTKKPIERE